MKCSKLHRILYSSRDYIMFHLILEPSKQFIKSIVWLKDYGHENSFYYNVTLIYVQEKYFKL